jgi:hypothetical protein
MRHDVIILIINFLHDLMMLTAIPNLVTPMLYRRRTFLVS